jgi:hypothetical protein
MAFGPPPPASVERIVDPGNPAIVPNAPPAYIAPGFDNGTNYQGELAIVSAGINGLVEIIKRKLGRNNQEVNQKVINIVNGINNAMTTINNNYMNYLETRFVDRNANQEAIVRPGLTNLNAGLVGTEFTNIQNMARTRNPYRDDPANVGEAIVKIDNRLIPGRHITINMTDLQHDNGSSLNPEYTAGQLDLANNQADINTVQTRLDNCQRLEMLYLIKHEELMKTFTFTLNLFDKYQYSTKLLLFVLKNLVNKQPPGHPPYVPMPIRINLPKPLIRNIKELLKDQQKMGDVITEMRNALDDDSVRDIASTTKYNPTSDELERQGRLRDQTIPP